MSDVAGPNLFQILIGDLTYLLISVVIIVYFGGLDALQQSGPFTDVISFLKTVWIITGAILGFATINQIIDPIGWGNSGGR